MPILLCVPSDLSVTAQPVRVDDVPVANWRFFPGLRIFGRQTIGISNNDIYSSGLVAESCPRSAHQNEDYKKNCSAIRCCDFQPDDCLYGLRCHCTKQWKHI